MARSNKPDVGATVARLEEQILAVATEVQALEAERRRALIAVAQEQEGAEADAQRHAADIREKRDHLQALRGAFDDAKQAQDAIAADAVAAEAQREREGLKVLARAARKAADHLDEQVSEVGRALLALREATKALWESSDGPTRSGELGEVPRLLSDLPIVVHERLAHAGVLASRSVAFDPSAPAPSVALHLNIALDMIAPGPGRPAKSADAAKGIAA